MTFLPASVPPVRLLLVMLAFAAISLAWSCVAWADDARVSIDNFTFAPATLTIAPGTTVTWTNADDIPHTVAASDKSFKSKVLDTDEHFSFTFRQPGTYAYFCSLHPHMTGQIIVAAP
jgi:plastocyanin